MKILTGAVLAASLGLAGAANAATYIVTVWTGAPNGTDSSTTADLAGKPGGLASAMFTYTGPIDWVNEEAQNSDSTGNLFSNFFNTYSADITGFSSPRGTYANEAAFLADSMSNAGDSYDTYMQITGNAATAVTGTITHDDGASVYDLNSNAVYSSPAETSSVTGNFSLPAGDFTVDYVEANGSPSILEFATSVPEPATWAMLLAGFAFVGYAMRRRRTSVSFA
ncbi:MAG: PEPxxWA-CTERM sorting domain-containing protein [Caulobacteraceae bacterium]